MTDESSKITPPAIGHGGWAFTANQHRLFRWARPALMVYWPLLAISTHQRDIGRMVPNPSLIWINLDKLLHAVCFGLLALLLIYARVTGRAARFTRNVWVGTVVAGVYAIVDETTQGLFGRTTSLYDLYADLAGISAVGWMVWFVAIRQKKNA